MMTSLYLKPNLAAAVLTTQPLYATSAIPLPGNILRKIDRPRRGLFWKGAVKCSGGDCLVVAWPLACRDTNDSLFGWLVADGWCWFVMREEYCWLVAAGCWWLIRSERKVLLAGG
jgi:hypothetical protein